MERLKRWFQSDGLLILLIMAIGAALRLWRLNDIPFMHDEFSAILRTGYDGFSELIEKGVKPDGHPPLIQVFLYFLVKTFGISEPVLKLPFILMGTASVWLLFRIGKAWFGSATGLAAAAFLSFLQFPVMYSQIARPYASGLFLTLLMVFFLTDIIHRTRKAGFITYAGYATAAALCAYNHHFSLLFAGMAGITGLILGPKERLKPLLAANFVVVLLYIPNLPLFLHQLGLGGVEGWLDKPRADFILDFLRYAFQFDPFIYLLLLALVSLSLYWQQKGGKRIDGRLLATALIWFLLPWLTGYLYSTFRSAVLQYSTLLFSFPYLLLFLFAFFREISFGKKAAVVALIAVVVIPSLVHGRKHYTVFYHGIYREMAVETNRIAVTPGVERCRIVLDAMKEIHPYYEEMQGGKTVPFNYFGDLWKTKQFVTFADTSSTPWFLLGTLSSTRQESYPIILRKYPFLVDHKRFFGGDIYLFSKQPDPSLPDEYHTRYLNDFGGHAEGWPWIGKEELSDSMPPEGNRSYLLRSGQEFGATFQASLRGMIKQESDIIDVSADLQRPVDSPETWLVAAVTSGDRTLMRVSSPVSDFVQPGSAGRVWVSLKCSDLDFRHHRILLTAYLWNPGKGTCLVDNFSVAVRSGNPFIYGLFRDIPRE